MTENMGKVTTRNSVTARGVRAISSWTDDQYLTSIIALYRGYYPNSRLEIVSALNSFNIAAIQYHYNGWFSLPKANIKLYMSAVQSVASSWNSDDHSGVTDQQKSGSWPP